MTVSTDIPIGNLNGWRQIFVDDFTIDRALGSFPESDPKWTAYPSPWWDTSHNGIYSPHSVISVSDGILTKYIHTEGDRRMIAAIMPFIPTDLGGQIYGRYAVRWRSDTLPGYKVAWLLWPDTNVLSEGEIDLPEMDLDSSKMAGYVHRVDGTPTTQGYVYVPINVNNWHTTIIEWSPNLIVFLHDDVEVYRTDGDIPDTPMHWVLQTETKLFAPTPDAQVKGNVQLMWVAAWAYDPTVAAPSTPRTVSIDAPATAVGVIDVTVNASPDVRQVKLMIDDVEKGWSATRPYVIKLDSEKYSNGPHTLKVKALSSWWFESSTRTINVRNVWKLIAPDIGTGIIPLSITPYFWYKQVQWVVDGRIVGSKSAAPFQFSWNTALFSKGFHTIYCKVLSEFGWLDGAKQTIEIT